MKHHRLHNVGHEEKIPSGCKRNATGISTPARGGNEEGRAMQRIQAEALPIPKTCPWDGKKAHDRNRMAPEFAPFTGSRDHRSHYSRRHPGPQECCNLPRSGSLEPAEPDRSGRSGAAVHG